MTQILMLLVALPLAWAFLSGQPSRILEFRQRTTAPLHAAAQEDNLLAEFGWRPFFADQLKDHEESLTSVRVTQVHSRGLSIIGAGRIDDLIPNTAPAKVVVGDWILVNSRGQILDILNRHSLLQRGKGGGRIQYLAANVDTALIVSSCNQEFNVARLERYVVLALQCGVKPVIVLTKRDEWEGEEGEEMLEYYYEEASSISPSIPVILVDATEKTKTTVQEELQEWLQPGKTLALMGSSGVGKSTLTNALCGGDVAKTGAIHLDSGQGRHTTSSRRLYFLPQGCAVLDTPGLREIQLIGATQGIEQVFSDLVDLSQQCGFRDCQHQGEPDCAIQAAIENGSVDPERVDRWQKLVAEDELNLKTLEEHERRTTPKTNKKKKKVTPNKSQQKKNKKYRKRLERDEY